LSSTQDIYTTKFQSVPENISKVEPFLEDVNCQLGLNEVDFHKLIVATTEAVNNAILHGNQANPEKNVTVKVVIKKNYLIVSVCDEGGGFDMSDIPNPLAEENLLKESGRGLFLMETLMEEVEIKTRNTGCEVRMSMYIGPKSGLKDEKENP
jgi:serine/threonine-protein kinase RsbW